MISGVALNLSIRTARARVWVLVVAAVACAIVVRTQFFLALAIGESMVPTINHGELLLVMRSAYRRAEPCRGDIVLAHLRRECLVKRVVGLPGEEIEVHRGVLLVNGTQWPEPYIHPGSLTIPQAALRENHFAVLGDNRALPEGFAIHGIISRTAIVGRVIYRMRF